MEHSNAKEILQLQDGSSKSLSSSDDDQPKHQKQRAWDTSSSLEPTRNGSLTDEQAMQISFQLGQSHRSSRSLRIIQSH